MAEEKKNVRARFYSDPVNGDVVELRLAGDPFNTTSLQKVSPEHVAQFPLEWEAYQDGKEQVDHGGTPLTDVPGFLASMTTAFALNGVHNAEHLASLTDGHLASLGLGGRGLREAARMLLKAREQDAELDRLRALIEAPAETPKKPKAA